MSYKYAKFYEKTVKSHAEITMITIYVIAYCKICCCLIRGHEIIIIQDQPAQF